jgi:NAD(P)-dependent dehydrogenase (short-subunit alcohol dehydrogenase family)
MLSGKPFSGKGIIITGGGSGLGLQMAHTLGSYGAVIHIIGRDQEKLNNAGNTLREKGIECFTYSSDIRDFEKIKDIVDTMMKEHEISGLINNAAGNFISRTEDLSLNGFLAVLNIVLTGSINITLEVGKRWIKDGKRGNILSILATYVDTGSPYVVPSATAKSGLQAFTRSIAAEWGPKGIRANGIAPGPFKTDGAWKNLIPGDEAENLMVNRNPMRRLGKKEEIGELAAYLMSDAAEYINGETIRIDGGEYINSASQFSMLSMLPDSMWEEMKERRNKK